MDFLARAFGTAWIKIGSDPFFWHNGFSLNSITRFVCPFFFTSHRLSTYKRSTINTAHFASWFRSVEFAESRLFWTNQQTIICLKSEMWTAKVISVLNLELIYRRYHFISKQASSLHCSKNVLGNALTNHICKRLPISMKRRMSTARFERTLPEVSK